ncbi:hypothetical protein CLV55_10113 [Flavobacterium aciduliphilum]|uniref:Uncharacterized protein n=1 Tax=Flavobacterium aciduliphilum TaxID=1101402 RepID=A0A328YMG4_9FLAO|nr:hypothetical protein CLV55_10113 [Flavobacterium aciduliphilum]
MKKKFFLTLAITTLVTLCVPQVYAQGDGPAPPPADEQDGPAPPPADEQDGPAPPPPSAPIDMCVPFLLASALCYGYRLKRE